MTDLAKLASEITPGPWEAMVFHEDTDLPFIHILGPFDKNKRHLVNWTGPAPDATEIANATAMSLVPELIAEVLRLRKENERLKYCRKAIDEVLVETNFISLQSARSYLSEVVDVMVDGKEWRTQA